VGDAPPERIPFVSTAERAEEAAAPLSAILLMMGAGLLFTCLDTTAKYLVLAGLDVQFVVWVRYAVHLVLVLVLFRAWSSLRLFRTHSLVLQVVRAACLLGSTFFNFLALQTLQLAETVSIFFFAPMVITALAGPLLGEWAGWRRWAAIGAGFLGVLLITRPGLGTFAIGHVYALGSMLSYAFYAILTRRMGATETAESMIFYSALAPVILMAPVVPVYGEVPSSLLIVLLLVSLGVYGGLGHWLIIKAYKQATATALAPYPYLQMVWMVGAGYLVFGDLPDGWTLVGAAVIVSSGLYIIHREHRLRLASRTAPNTETGDLAKKL
jgi:drug/metabolite transporter (DMT)-like permease